MLPGRGLDEVEPAFSRLFEEMYAGLLPMDNGNRRGEIMFWLFAPDHPAVPDSLIWFNGDWMQRVPGLGFW
jgi:hypothetical protein